MKRITVSILIMVTTTILSAHAAESEPNKSRAQRLKPSASYVPGMGEIMGATQMRHSKLWFAGNARNWELASYELDEIREGFHGTRLRF